jgi:hypothetical protein
VVPQPAQTLTVGLSQGTVSGLSPWLKELRFIEIHLRSLGMSRRQTRAHEFVQVPFFKKVEIFYLFHSVHWNAGSAQENDL